ncbi:MAG: ROK family protein [Candidatus Omnitrophica bacterium]|nr:ROK family protein [Candidatus Omnitrophota bacterium]
MELVNLEGRRLTEKEKRGLEILQILRRFGPISRTDISARTGFNIVTVSNYVDDFLKDNLVKEAELDISEGGRRPMLLEFNSNCAFGIGVGVNLNNIVGVLIDAKGRILLKTQLSPERISVEGVIESILSIIREILRRSKEYTGNIKGIGVGLAGIINKKSGTFRWPQRIGADVYYVSLNPSLGDLIGKEFGFPVIVENDANCACFGEQWLVLGSDVKDVVYMFSGVGAGIMINGELYTGSIGCAGELCIYSRKKEQFNPEFGDISFLKPWQTDLGIVEDVKNRLLNNQNGGKQIHSFIDYKIEKLSLKIIFNAALSGDELAKASLDIAAKKLGIKIAYLVNLLNPDVVVIGGSFEEAGEEFLNNVTQTINDWGFCEATDNLKVVYSQLRENAIAQGAASIVMQRIFAYKG